jgi:hypothetical protein
LRFDVRVQLAERRHHQPLQRRAVRAIEQRQGPVASGRPAFVLVLVPRQQLQQRVRAIDNVARVVQEQGALQRVAHEPVERVPGKGFELRASSSSRLRLRLRCGVE